MTTATPRPVVLVFGESENDTKAIINLARGLRPDLGVQFEARRQPLVMIKNAKPEHARSNAEKIAKLVKQEAAARPVASVMAHEDCDALEPKHLEVAKKIEDALMTAGCPGTLIGVAPAWELESWWLVFPDAVVGVVQGWREPNEFVGADVGKIVNSKEELSRAVRPADGKSKPRGYAESDSVQIASNVVARNLLPSFDNDHRTTKGKGVAQTRTRSASFGEFRRKVLALRAV